MTDHVQNVCKIGQGAACCRYLVAGSMGLECMKSSSGNKSVIDKAWADGTKRTAQGDNCEGVTDLAKLNELQTATMQPGDYVHYNGTVGGAPENGRIKSIKKNIAFVVFKCAGEWEHYQEYTGQSVPLEDLAIGWVDERNVHIPTPDSKTKEEL